MPKPVRTNPDKGKPVGAKPSSPRPVRANPNKPLSTSERQKKISERNAGRTGTLSGGKTPTRVSGKGGALGSTGSKYKGKAKPTVTAIKPPDRVRRGI
jgi:hypothetical protein